MHALCPSGSPWLPASKVVSHPGPSGMGLFDAEENHQAEPQSGHTRGQVSIGLLRGCGLKLGLPSDGPSFCPHLLNPQKT